MRLSLIILRCPKCGILQVDYFSLMTLEWGGGHASSNAQNCQGCGTIIPTADHSRSGSSLHIISGRGGVEAFAVELIAGLGGVVHTDGTLRVSKTNYDKLPPILQTLVDIVQKYGVTPATIAAILMLLNWAKPFLLEHQRHLNAVSESELEHKQALIELGEIGSMLDTESRLRTDLARMRSEQDSMLREEVELLRWLDTVPEFRAPMSHDTPQGAFGQLQIFLENFNLLNRRLKAIEARLDEEARHRKQALLDAAGSVQPLVEFPERAPKEKSERRE